MSDELRCETLDLNGCNCERVVLSHSINRRDMRNSRCESKHQRGSIRVFIGESGHFEFFSLELNNNPLASILRTVNDLLDEIVSSVFPVTGDWIWHGPVQ